MSFPPFSKLHENECFPGIRFYRTTEGGQYQDVVGEFSPLLHPKINLVILGEDSWDSSFHPCPEENYGQVTWPNRMSALPSVDIHAGTDIIRHARGVYEDWNATGWNGAGVQPNRRDEIAKELKLALSAGALVTDVTVWFPAGNKSEEGFSLLKKDLPHGGHLSHGYQLPTKKNLHGFQIL